MLIAQRHASQRSVQELALDSPMEIASEMARIVLAMKNGRNAALKQRLELLAESFLRIAGQDGESGSIDGIDIGNRRPSGVPLTM